MTSQARTQQPAAPRRRTVLYVEGAATLFFIILAYLFLAGPFFGWVSGGPVASLLARVLGLLAVVGVLLAIRASHARRGR